MKRLWYFFVKAFIRLGFTFFYKDVRREGLDNLVKNQPILFVANHQNALIDPLLIGAYTPRVLHFLTRADVFNKPLIKLLLASVNMMPIYRIRDGRSSLSKNQEIFDKCHSIFSKDGSVLIFPEGNHNILRRIRPLSKGFTRIVSGTLDKHPELDLYIQPIGINYSDHKRYGSRVSIYYGQALRAKDHIGGTNDKDELLNLKDVVSEALKNLTTHIDDLNNYQKINVHFVPSDFLNPEKVNRAIRTGRFSDSQPPEKSKWNLIQKLVRANSFLVLILWNRFKPGISEPEFVATFKFVFAILITPVCYLLQALLLGWIFGAIAGWTYFFVSVLAAYTVSKTAD